MSGPFIQDWVPDWIGMARSLGLKGPKNKAGLTAIERCEKELATCRSAFAKGALAITAREKADVAMRAVQAEAKRQYVALAGTVSSQKSKQAWVDYWAGKGVKELPDIVGELFLREVEELAAQSAPAWGADWLHRYAVLLIASEGIQ